MRQLSWRAFALAVLMAAPGLAGAQAETIRIGKTGEIELVQPTRLGTTVLQAGHYEVQHAAANGEHYVVVRERVQMNRRHSSLVTGREVARVPCRVMILERPARFSFAYWTKGADGKPMITEIRIADEPAGHIVALEPTGAR